MCKINNIFNKKNVIIAPKKRLIYLAIPKCANRSFKYWMISQTELSNDFNELQRHKIQFIDDNISLQALLDKGYLKHKDITHYFKFTFFRNPYERILSAFNDKFINGVILRDNIMYDSIVPYMLEYSSKKYLNKCTFNDFVNTICLVKDDIYDDPHWRRQTWYTEKFPVDFIGLLEKVDSDIKRLSNILDYDINMYHIGNKRMKRSFKTKIKKLYIKYKTQDLHLTSIDELQNVKNIDLVPKQFFITEDLKSKIYEKYKNDFKTIENLNSNTIPFEALQ